MPAGASLCSLHLSWDPVLTGSLRAECSPLPPYTQAGCGQYSRLLGTSGAPLSATPSSCTLSIRPAVLTFHLMPQDLLGCICLGFLP